MFVDGPGNSISDVTDACNIGSGYVSGVGVGVGVGVGSFTGWAVGEMGFVVFSCPVYWIKKKIIVINICYSQPINQHWFAIDF